MSRQRWAALDTLDRGVFFGSATLLNRNGIFGLLDDKPNFDEI